MPRIFPVLVSLVCLSAPTEAAAEWLAVRTNHFQIVGDVSERDMQTVALRLEQFREALTQVAPDFVHSKDGPDAVVVVFPDDQFFEPFMPRSIGSVVPVGSFYQGGSDVNYIAFSLQPCDKAYRHLFHQYAHLLLRAGFPDAPIGFSEGLAEYYSTFAIVGDGWQAHIGHPVPEHVELLQGARLALSRLFAVTRNSREYVQDRGDRAVFYAHAWAIVHQAFHSGPRRPHLLHDLAQRVARGVTLEAALRSVYDVDVQNFERALRQYTKQQTHDFTVVTFNDRIVSGIDAQAQRLSAAQVDAWLGDLLFHTGRVPAALARLE